MKKIFEDGTRLIDRSLIMSAVCSCIFINFDQCFGTVINTQIFAPINIVGKFSFHGGTNFVPSVCHFSFGLFPFIINMTKS